MSLHPQGEAGSNRPSPKARKCQPERREFSKAELELASQIRSTYVECRSAFENLRRGSDKFLYVVPHAIDKGTQATVVDGKDVAGKPPLWNKLARQFLQLKIDASDYIRRTFDHAAQLKAPEAARLLDQQYLEAYRTKRVDSTEECLIAFNTQREIAANEVAYWQNAGFNFVQSHSSVIGDEEVDLSALFRYCLAVELIRKKLDPVFKRLAVTYRRPAAIQFQHNATSYLKTWGKFIPRRFIRRSEKIYRRMHSGDD